MRLALRSSAFAWATRRSSKRSAARSTAARTLVHGKACTVRHDGRGLFSGLPDELEVGRYHSLAATQIPPLLEISATAADGEVMAVRHRELPVDGVQFHPDPSSLHWESS